MATPQNARFARNVCMYVGRYVCVYVFEYLKGIAMMVVAGLVWTCLYTNARAVVMKINILYERISWMSREVQT